MKKKRKKKQQKYVEEIDRVKERILKKKGLI